MTPLLQLVAQRHPADCGVACLAMMLSVSYEDALLALGGEVPKVLRRGVWFTELQRAAAKFGVKLKIKARWDAEDDEGIAQVRFRDGDHHVVLLRHGLLFETDLSVWEPDDYWRAKKAEPGSLLVREDT